MSFAIVILNHKTSHLLRGLLKHLLNQCAVAGEQIQVVDNSLDKKEKEILEELKYLYKFNLSILETNRGYSAGNNVGIEMAINSGFSYFFVVNPDVIPNSNVCNEMYKKYLNHTPGFCVGPRVFNPFIGLDENPLKYPNYFLSLFGMAKKHRADDTLLAGSFLYFDKVYWLNIGKFPEEVFMYNEEAIIFFRGKNLSLSTIYDPTFVILHNHEKVFKGFRREWSRKKAQLKSSIFVMKEYLEYRNYTLSLYVVLFLIRTFFVFVYKIIRYGKI
jgi:GT2 family glycosyltransferase